MLTQLEDPQSPRMPALPAFAAAALRQKERPRHIIMAERSAAGFAAAMRLGGFEPPTLGLEGRRSVH